MQSSITLAPNGTGSFLGSAAQPFLYSPLRERLAELLACDGANKFWVFEKVGNDAVCRAAQPTRDGASKFMTESRVLVELENSVA